MGKTATLQRYRQNQHHGDMWEPFAAKPIAWKLVAFGWPVIALCWIFAQAAPSSADIGGLDRLLEIGAIGAVLAVIMWQQFRRELRLSDEVKSREDRMAERITTLEEHERQDVVALREHNEKLQQIITDKLMTIVREQASNVESCHKWRVQANQTLMDIKSDIQDE